jgi:uncharacterized protein with HEPN domain
MPLEEKDAAYLLDMLTAAQAVVRYVAGKTLANYVGDEILRDAVERRVEVIGEAAGNVSKACKDANPHIPWRKIIAQRNVLAHDYGDIDHEVLWRVATVHVPDLLNLLCPLLPPAPPDPEPSP